MPYSLQSILSDDPWRQAALSLADIAAKGLLLLAIALLLTAFLRRSSAAKRHLVWALTFAGILLLPLLEAFTPDLRLGILPGKTPASAEVQQTAPPLPTDVEPKHISALEPISRAPESPIREMDTSPEPSPTAPPSIPNPSQLPDANPPLSFLVMIVWLAGVMATAAPLLLGLFAISRVTRKARPFAESRLEAIKESLTAELGIASRVSILRAAKGSMPMATGLWRPAILLPAEAAEWPDEKSRTVLLHELAHVKRRDCLTQFIASLAVALHWFNPLAWWALRQMRIERERACDDLVLAAGERPSAYAEQLLQIAHETHAATLISVAAITMAKRSQLEGRLEAVLDPKRNRNRVKKWSIVLGVLLLAAIAVPLGMLKVSEHRVFSEMTPEQRRDFDVWRTQKLTFPPEALEIKTFAPEIIARVRAFEAEWARSREEANTIADEWKEFLEAAGQIPILPSDFDEQLTKRLTKVDALVWRFESVVTHPEYDLDVWTVGIKTIAVEVDGKKHGGQQVPPSKDFPPHPDWASIRCAATLLQFKSGVMLEADDLPAATDCAEALVMAARVHPYTTNINRMVGVAILKLAYLPWEKIIEETKDPAILDQTRARLRADLEKIDLSLPPDLGWVAADNIGMIREARRWGIEGSIQNKTGLELMEEVSAVRARYMRKYNLEEEAAIARLEKSIADIAHPKGIISRWTSPINAATLYSIALPGFERAEREMQKLLSQFEALASEPNPDDKSTTKPTSSASLPDPVWGEEVNGLVAAVELRRVGLDPPTDNVGSGVGSESQPTPHTFAHGERIDVRFRIKNVSDRTIRFSSEDLRQDHAILQDSSGKGISGNNLWFTAWPVQQSYELKPGKEVVLDNYDLALAANKAQADAFKHPIGSSFICPPGDYALHYAVKLPGVEQRDASGKTTVPRKGDWTGTLITGPIPITVVPASKPASKPQHAFAIYEVRSPVYPVDAEKMRKMDLEELALSDKPFLTDEDIVSYEWPTGEWPKHFFQPHVIHLKPGVRERIVPNPKTPWAIGFVVMANGERIYYGELETFLRGGVHISPMLSVSEDDEFHISGVKHEGSRAGSFDDPRIREALGDKIRILEPQPRDEPTSKTMTVLPTTIPTTRRIIDKAKLLQDLQSSDELVRAEALQELGTASRIARNDKQVLDALIKAMSDSSFRVQYAANQAMMNVGPVNIAAIRAVIRAVRANADKFSPTGAHTGSTGDIVLNSQIFFAKLNDTHAYAIPDFVSLAKEPQVGVQRVAIHALMSIGTVPPELGPMLMKNLKDEQLYWAEGALHKLGAEAAPYVPELIEMLNAKDWASKTAAARVLASIGRPAADPAIPVLEESVKIADDPRGTMSESLLKLDPQSQAALDRLEILANTPNGPDPTSSSYARGLLIKYGRNVDRHTQGLVKALEDSNLRNSAMAVKMILENSSNKEARQAALEQAQRIRDSFDADDWTVQTVLQGLQSADKPLDQNP